MKIKLVTIPGTIIHIDISDHDASLGVEKMLEAIKKDFKSFISVLESDECIKSINGKELDSKLSDGDAIVLTRRINEVSM